MSTRRLKSAASDARALPFIYTTPEQPERFEIGEEAVTFLSHLKTAVAPVAVVGKYRTGKSFLLNNLVGTPGAFGVGSTVEACTRGIWVWSEPLPITLPDGQTCNVLFFDTEGIGATGSTAEHDARVFSLATLLCSLLVYNSVGAIDEEAISSLAFIAHLTRHIDVRSNEAGGKSNGSGGSGGTSGGRKGMTSMSLADADDDDDDDEQEEEEDEQDVDSDDSDAVARHRMRQAKKAAARKGAAAKAASRSRNSASNNSGSSSGGGGGSGSSSGGSGGASESELSTFFPGFLWVLRDFTLEMRDDAGELQSPKDYLESCLAQADGFSSDAQLRNRTRRVLTAYFKERDCVTLVRPLEDEALLAAADSQPWASLRPEFRTELLALRAKIMTELVRPKTMHGQVVTGKVLAGLARAYVAAINNHAVPSIGNAWDGVTRMECAEAAAAAAALYDGRMAQDAHLAALPLDEPELAAIHARHEASALEAYANRAVGPSADKYRGEVTAHIAQAYAVLLQSNATASEIGCARTVARLWREYIEPQLLRSSSGSSSSGGSGTVYASFESFAADLNHLKEEYYMEAKGPAVHKALGHFLLEAMPGVVRAVNAARGGEAEARLTALAAQLGGLQEELSLSQARASVFESQVADLRAERQSSTVDKARAEQEAKTAKSELAAAHARIEELTQGRTALEDKLKQEKVAHAQTRLQLRAAGSGAGSGASGDGAAATAGGRGASSGAGAVAASSAGGVDAAAIILAASGGVVSGSKPMDARIAAALATTTAASGIPTKPVQVVRQPLKPVGAEEIAQPGLAGPVAFPPPPQQNCCCVQ